MSDRFRAGATVSRGHFARKAGFGSRFLRDRDAASEGKILAGQAIASCVPLRTSRNPIAVPGVFLIAWGKIWMPFEHE